MQFLLGRNYVCQLNPSQLSTHPDLSKNEIQAYFFFFFFFWCVIHFFFIFFFQQLITEHQLFANPPCTVLRTGFIHSDTVACNSRFSPSSHSCKYCITSFLKKMWKEIYHSPQSALTKLCHHAVDFGQVNQNVRQHFKLFNIPLYL